MVKPKNSVRYYIRFDHMHGGIPPPSPPPCPCVDLGHFFLQIYVSVVDPDECRCERVVLEALAESEPELAKAEEQVGRC